MSHRPAVLITIAALFAVTLVPAVSAAAEEPATVELTGTLTRLSDEPGVEPGGALLDVEGEGYLSVDTSEVSVPASDAPVTVTLAVPEGADVSATDTTAEVFDELSDSTVDIVAVDSPDVQDRVTRTPNTGAAHQVYAVLVSPSGAGQASEQTAAAVQNTVAHLDDYWNQQSSGSIRFSLARTDGWYSSSLNCATNYVGLFNEAKKRTGFTDGPNKHLVLFFPTGADCGGPDGRGSVGSTVNTGGVLWLRGTDSAVAKSALVHEMGHNISLGHANWAECTSATPNPGPSGTNGCAIRPYGDMLDVQAAGFEGFTGGALSAPQAVRASIWPASAAAQAPQGASTFTLNSVSSNTGLRSVIVDDTDGTSYFVEYRNFTDEDAQYAGWAGYCLDGAYCFSGAGVRVLRLEGAGGPGDGSYLIGRTVDGVDRTSFTAGETFHSQGAGGVSVLVTDVDGTTATVAVQIGGVAPPLTPQLSLSASAIEPGGTLTVKYATDAPDATNWIGIYAASESPSSVLSRNWQYAPGVTGTRQIPLWTSSFPAGDYLVYFFAKDGYTQLLPPQPLTVGTLRASLTLKTPGVVAPGSQLVVDYTTKEPGAKNWIGVYAAADGSPGSAAARFWDYAPGGSGTVTIPVKFPPGDYVVWFLANDGYGQLQRLSFRVG